MHAQSAPIRAYLRPATWLLLAASRPCSSQCELLTRSTLEYSYRQAKHPSSPNTRSNHAFNSLRLPAQAAPWPAATWAPLVPYWHGCAPTPAGSKCACIVPALERIGVIGTWGTATKQHWQLPPQVRALRGHPGGQRLSPGQQACGEMPLQRQRLAGRMHAHCCMPAQPALLARAPHAQLLCIRLRQQRLSCWGTTAAPSGRRKKERNFLRMPIIRQGISAPACAACLRQPRRNTVHTPSSHALACTCLTS